MSELEALVRFARSRFDGGPEKLHGGVRSIKAGRYGFTSEATAWIFGDDGVTMKQTSTAPCSHQYSAELGGCVWCGVHGADGRIIAHKGLRTTSEVAYRFPYKAALGKLKRLPVPAGLPRLDAVVQSVVRAGRVDTGALVEGWPALIDEAGAMRHAVVALRRFRAVYSEAPPQHRPR